MKEVFNQMVADDFEQVLFCQDGKTGLKAIIVLHDTVLGPALGGCRYRNYQDTDEALWDVMRLAMGMTYKNSISQLHIGGGKSVIIGDPAKKTPELLKRFGQFVDTLNGNYITAKDMNIDAQDLQHIHQGTQHVMGIEGDAHTSGDPSIWTALGLWQAQKAAYKHLTGSDSLEGVHVALQGVGYVGHYLCQHLHNEGAKITVCDTNKEAVDRCRQEFGVNVVEVDNIYDVDCDIFAPCAIGATINEKTIPRLTCKIIAGPANNQLEVSEDGERLKEKGILYAPDYVINAGGVINIAVQEIEGKNAIEAKQRIMNIYNTLSQVLDRAKAENVPTPQIADRMAMERIHSHAQ